MDMPRTQHAVSSEIFDRREISSLSARREPRTVMSSVMRRRNGLIALSVMGLLLMLWTAPTTGIAICPISTALEERRESAYGYKPTWAGLVKDQPSPPDLHALICNGFCLAYGGF